ncbi:MAG: putative LPS assembly protein LptD [Rikenellaceae bacterium]
MCTANAHSSGYAFLPSYSYPYTYTWDSTSSASVGVEDSVAYDVKVVDSLLKYAKDSLGFSLADTAKLSAEQKAAIASMLESEEGGLASMLESGQNDLASLQDSISRTTNSDGTQDIEMNIDPDVLKGMAGVDSNSFDSLAMAYAKRDSLGMLQQPKEEIPDSVKYGNKNFLDAPIFLDFADSLVYIPSTRDVFMYKTGKITYSKQELSADYIKLNTDTKLVEAEGVVTDTVTQERSQVIFVDGAADYEMDSMTYNLDSGKALIHGVKTVEGEGIMYGGTVKKMKDNVTHMHAGRYTTCDADCPHFYLQMTKATVVPNKVTVFGPAYLVFEDVPLYPLTIPFGFFPQKTERNSGVIIPSVGEESARGFYLDDLGYYFAINDYVDLKLTGSIYSLGSWNTDISSNYAWRYKFKGSVNISFAETIYGEIGSYDYVNSQGFSVKWTHTQDAKFSPSSTFSASVNFTSNSTYDKYNSSSLSDAMNTQTSSTIAYSKSWSGTPISLSVNASYNQNNQDSTITMGLPTMVLNVSRVTPFQRKNLVGGEKWYEKISFTYNMEYQSRVSSLDQELLFKDEMWDQVQMGVKHTLPVSASFNIGGVFNLTPSFSYNEKWYFKKTEQTWNDETESIDYDTLSGFYRLYDYSVSLGMNTTIYGEYTLGTKKKSIFRHVMTPTISLSYAPDFGAASYGFWKTVQSSADGSTTEYSPYSGSLYGTGSSSATAQVSFSLSNTLEAKIPSDKDTSGFKKVKIIEGLSISSSYNFLADSLKLNPFSVSLRIPIVTGYTLNLSGTLDPYALQDGKKVDRFLVEEGGFLRVTSLSFSAGYSFKSKASSSKSSSGPAAINDPDRNNSGNNYTAQVQNDNLVEQAIANGEQISPLDRAYVVAGQYYNFAIPWSLNFDYSFRYSNSTGDASVTQTVNASGSINLTDKWAISASLGYDIEMGEITPGTVQVTRDLHCWQMSFSWVPVGYRQSWSFTIQAKSSMLSDLLKYDKDQSFYDNYYY